VAAIKSFQMQQLEWILAMLLVQQVSQVAAIKSFQMQQLEGILAMLLVQQVSKVAAIKSFQMQQLEWILAMGLVEQVSQVAAIMVLMEQAYIKVLIIVWTSKQQKNIISLALYKCDRQILRRACPYNYASINNNKVHDKGNAA
jgi:hypothetical protein